MMTIFEKVAVLSDVIRCRYSGGRLPVSVQLALTNRCPRHCLYCSTNTKNTSELSTRQIQDIIRQLAANKTRRLHLVGGEPLLREDIGEIIEAAKARKIFVTLATSGYQLIRNWDKIKNLDIFFLSFDGPPEIHDLQRGEGSFKTLFESIEFLKSRKKKFWTTTVVTRLNAAHLDYILQAAKDKGFLANFQLLYFDPAFRFHHQSIHPDVLDERLVMDNEQYLEALKYLLKRKKSDARNVIGSSAGYFENLLKWGDFTRVYRTEKSKDYDCLAGRMYCYIDANGDLYPCCDVMGVVQPRNLLKEGFREAFAHLSAAPCKSCLVACYAELNLMFSLSPGSIFNWLNKV
jgi:MoaA/NifB/PqqE/SkfB family radical SAM enzyme